MENRMRRIRQLRRQKCVPYTLGDLTSLRTLCFEKIKDAAQSSANAYRALAGLESAEGEDGRRKRGSKKLARARFERYSLREYAPSTAQ